MTAGTVRFSIGLVEGLNLDVEARVGRGQHAVALLLVVGLPVLPTAPGFKHVSWLLGG